MIFLPRHPDSFIDIATGSPFGIRALYKQCSFLNILSGQGRPLSPELFTPLSVGASICVLALGA